MFDKFFMHVISISIKLSITNKSSLIKFNGSLFLQSLRSFSTCILFLKINIFLYSLTIFFILNITSIDKCQYLSYTFSI